MAENKENCASPVVSDKDEHSFLCPETPELVNLSADGAGSLSTPRRVNRPSRYFPTPPSRLSHRQSLSFSHITPACSPAYMDRSIPKEDRANMTFCLGDPNDDCLAGTRTSDGSPLTEGANIKKENTTVHIGSLIDKIVALQHSDKKKKTYVAGVPGNLGSQIAGCASPKMQQQFESPTRRPQF